MDFFINSFQLILRSSIMATFVAVIILFIKLVFKEKIGVRGNYFIWLILILRLLMPYTPQSQISFFNLFNHNYTMNKVINSSEIKLISKGTPINIAKSNSKVSVSQNTNSIKSSTVNNNLKYAAFVWALVAAILALKMIITTILFYYKLSSYKEIRDGDILKLVRECKNKVGINKKIKVYKTNIVKIPGIFGIFRPKLLLPANLEKKIDTDELKYIIFHELSHIKRKDIELSCVVSIIQIIHWFNPVLWYCFYKMSVDREIACDALAMLVLGENQSSSYGMTILKMVRSLTSTKTIYGMESFANNKDEVKRRIKMISKFKKRSYKLPIAAVVILIIIGAITLTNSKSIGLTGKNSTSKVADSKTSTGDKSTKDVTDDNDANSSKSSNKTNKSVSNSAKSTSKGESSSTQSATKKAAVAAQSKTSSSVDNSNKAYYGSWHLGKIVATSPVTAMDENEMQKYMGTKIAISKENFINARVGTVSNPKYIKSTISNDEFYTETKMQLKSIGVEANSVQKIEVQGNDGSGEGCIYVTENGSMITNIDGVFYKIQ